MPYSVRGVPSELVERFWPFAEPYIKRALDHSNGEYSSSDLCALCKNKDMQLWLISHEDRIIGAVTTTITNYPHVRVCLVVTLAGTKFDEWVDDAITIVSAWAKVQGCTLLTSYVRRGFAPKLQKKGFKLKHVVVCREI